MSGAPRNIVAVAGAGTGKTFRLVQHAAGALASGACAPGALAAITFTEHAAAELRERLVSTLEQLATGPRGEEPKDGTSAQKIASLLRAEQGKDPGALEGLQRNARAALDRIEDAFVGTIHAFCADLLRRHPVESGVSPAFQVDEGPAARWLVDKRWGEFLSAELGPGCRRLDLWRRLLEGLDPSEAARIGMAFCRFGIPAEELAGLPPEAEAARLLLPARASRLRAGLDGLGAPFRKGSSTAVHDALTAALDALSGGDPFAAIEACRAAALVAEQNEGGLTQGSRDAGAVSPAAFKERMKAASDFVKRAAELDPRAVDDLVAALGPFGTGVQNEARLGGLLGFDALLRLARNLLRDAPEVRAVEADRLRLLLVDEFQDTDPLQYEIILMLAARVGSEGRDPYALDLEPGRLFLVGDPKQSIYRFRGADIAACTRALDRVLEAGGAREFLDRNRRSPPEILEPLNRLFVPAFAGGPRALQPEYEPISAARDHAGSQRITVISIPPAGDGKKNVAALRAREARVIAGEISRLIQAREFRAGECAVLLPALTVGPIYAGALREAGIPFVMEGGRIFRDRNEVRLALAILTTLCEPDDGVAWLAVARSALGAASDRELARWAAAGGWIPPRGRVDEEAFPGVARTERLLAEIRRRGRGRSAGEAIRAVLEATPVAALVAAAPDGAQRAANVSEVVARAAALASGHGLSIRGALDALGDALEEEGRGDIPLADERLDAARVMTVHKAKGLEFAAVFLADLGRSQGAPRGQDEEVLWRARDGGGVALATRRPDGTKIRSLSSVLARLEETAEEEAESVRKLYVAATRAKERLFFVVSDPKGDGTWSRHLAAWGWAPAAAGDAAVPLCDGAVEHRVAAPALTRLRAAPEEGTDALARAVRRFDEAQDALRVFNRPWTVTPSGQEDSPERRRLDLSEEVEDGESGGADAAAAAGSAYHRLVERWDLRDPGSLRRFARAAARHEAAVRLVDPAAVERELEAILNAFLAGPLPGRLAVLDLVGREVPFLHPREGTLVLGIADLVYREPDGTWVVADHKTDRIPGEGPGALKERYQPQLSLYGDALRAALPAGTPVRTELWLARSGEILRLDG